MKKLSILFAALFMSIASFAQPQAGSFGVEMNINFGTIINVSHSSWGGSIIESNSLTDAVRARYFLTDNMALRGVFSFTRVSLQEGTHTTINNPRITWEEGDTRFGFSPGFEYHITKFERGSVYFGGDFSFDFMTTTRSSRYHNSESTVFGYGLSAFTGVDYYITRNLYLGAELSFGFMARRVSPRSTSTNVRYWRSFDVGFRAIPAFRVGWTF